MHSKNFISGYNVGIQEGYAKGIEAQERTLKAKRNEIESAVSLLQANILSEILMLITFGKKKSYITKIMKKDKH